MTETVATQVKAIAFDRDIERLTEGFTGREWVFEEIDRWLQQGNERFFILTGEPGVGKSAIAAKLTQIRQDIAAYHFCIAGRSGTIEPNGVLLSLAAQLIDYFPDYAEALAKTIKPLKLSIHVEINIETLKDSEVRGVVISNLHTQNPQEALNIVLRQALAALPKPPQESKIILIDSLDEAVTFGNRDNLATLLSGLNDLPSWVRLILTSRPEDRVLVEFKPLEPYSIEETSAESLADIRQYVEERMEQPALQEQLSKANVVPLVLIDQVVQLSSGNFLYTKLLLDEIEAKRQLLNDLSALPKNIDDIYLTFLRRFKHEDWKRQYQPILGTLTAALEPVTENELENFTNIKPRQLRQDLGIIRQFLDEAKNEIGKTTYAIFHQSLRDYLQDKKRNQHFWCDAQEQHTLIIDYYKKKSQTWQQLSQIDRYGLRYLTRHLVMAERVEELHALLLVETSDRRNAWFVAKDQIGDAASFLADIAFAWNHAEEEFQRTHQGRLIGLQYRYALITATLNSISNNIPVSILVALVRRNVWTTKTGIDYACRILDFYQKIDALSQLQSCSSEPLKEEIEKLKEQIIQQEIRAMSLETYNFMEVDKLIELIPYFPTSLLTSESFLIEVFEFLDRAYIECKARNYARIDEPYFSSDTAFDTSNELKQGIEALKKQFLSNISLNITSRESKPLKAIEKNVLDLPINSEVHIEEVIKRIISEQEKSKQEVALANLILEVPKSLLNFTAQLVFEVISKVNDEDKRNEVLCGLIPYSSDLIKQQVLERFLVIEDNKISAILLNQLLPHLPKSSKSKVYNKILNIILITEERSDRWNLWKQFLPHIEESMQKELLPQALDCLVEAAKKRRYARKRYQIDELKELAINLSKPLRKKVFEKALEVTSKSKSYKKEYRLMELFPLLPNSLKSKALIHILADCNSIDCGKKLLALLPYLSKPLKYKAIDIITAPSLLDAYIDRWKEKGVLYYTLKYAQYLPVCLKHKIFLTASNVKSDSLQLMIFLALLPHLPKTLKKQVMQTISNVKEDVWIKILRNQNQYEISYLFPSLSNSLKSKLFDVTLAIKSSSNRLDRVSKLFPYLPHPLKEKALGTLLSFKSEILYTSRLLDVIPHLPAFVSQKMLQQILSVFQNEPQEDKQVQALVGLSPYLTDEQIQRQALSIIQLIKAKDKQIAALIKLLPHLKESFIYQWLSIVLKIKNTQIREQGLRMFSMTSETYSSSVMYTLWCYILHASSSRTRSDLLSDVGALMPAVVILGKNEAVTEVAQAIQDVGRWWN